uniref:Uncharacterized protein n=1 Tax=Anguilla anguilla TaxID=7936 RepID=A0A0E9Q747_ANGAN
MFLLLNCIFNLLMQMTPFFYTSNVGYLSTLPSSGCLNVSVTRWSYQRSAL